MILFSLVLPVYKVEPYIEKCILSCLDQKDINSTEYEIILVDDGTPDRSMEVAMEIVKKYLNHQVKVIHRKNGGLSAARNTGLQQADGKYVWFIDSDDWISLDALAILKQKIEKIGEVDILSFCHRTVYKDGAYSSLKEEKDYAGRGIEYLSKHNFLSACSRLYRLDYLKVNHFLFSEGYLWEDAQFNIRALTMCQKHYFCNVFLYYYLRRENSITTFGTTENMERSRFYLIDSVYDFFSDKYISKDEIRIINDKLSGFLLAAIVGLYELPKDISKKYYNHYKSREKFYLSFLRDSGSRLKYLLSIFLRVNFRVVQILLKYKMNKALMKNK